MNRVTFKKVNDEVDYVDARYDVFLDGEYVGQVTRNEETVGHSSGGLRYFTSTSLQVLWQADGIPFAAQHDTRVNAVIDLLQEVKGMSLNEAREASGKRGLY